MYDYYLIQGINVKGNWGGWNGELPDKIIGFNVSEHEDFRAKICFILSRHHNFNYEESNLKVWKYLRNIEQDNRFDSINELEAKGPDWIEQDFQDYLKDIEEKNEVINKVNKLDEYMLLEDPSGILGMLLFEKEISLAKDGGCVTEI